MLLGGTPSTSFSKFEMYWLIVLFEIAARFFLILQANCFVRSLCLFKKPWHQSVLGKLFLKVYFNSFFIQKTFDSHAQIICVKWKAIVTHGNDMFFESNLFTFVKTVGLSTCVMCLAFNLLPIVFLGMPYFFQLPLLTSNPLSPPLLLHSTFLLCNLDSVCFLEHICVFVAFSDIYLVYKAIFIPTKMKAEVEIIKEDCIVGWYKLGQQ